MTWLIHTTFIPTVRQPGSSQGSLAIAAIVLIAVIAGAVLLATRLWDDNGNGNGITNNNSVPSNNQPDSGGNTGNGAQPDGQ